MRDPDPQPLARGAVLTLDLPPIWLAGFLAAGWGLSRAAPVVPLASPLAAGFGWALIGAALVLAGWAALCFRRARTSVIPRSDASALVAVGPYRFSRNPIYLADLLILLSQGLILGSVWPLLLAPLFALVITRRFILAEEAMLQRRFPDQFVRWSATVRRWI